MKTDHEESLLPITGQGGRRPDGTDLQQNRLSPVFLCASAVRRIPAHAPLNRGAKRRFSRIRDAAHDPRDDRIESLLIERVSAVDSELRNEVAGNFRHDLVGIP